MSAPTLDQIRAAIKTRMLTASGIGAVNEYERYAKEQSKLAAEYVSGDRLHGWYIRRLKTREAHIDVGRYVIDHDWLMRGFYAIDDADESEKDFDLEIESIRDVFRTNSVIMTGVETCFSHDTDAAEAGVQVLDSGPVMFAGVLCHAARLGLTTRHYL